MSFGYVYKFLNEGGETIYVGVAKDLFSRLFNQHLGNNGHLDMGVISEIDTIKYTVFDSYIDASIFEIVYINEVRPKYNVRGIDVGDVSYEVPLDREWYRIPLVRVDSDTEVEEFCDKLERIHERGAGKAQTLVKEFNTTLNVLRQYMNITKVRDALTFRGLKMDDKGDIIRNIPNEWVRNRVIHRMKDTYEIKDVGELIGALGKMNISYKDFLCEKDTDKELEKYFIKLNESSYREGKGIKVCRNCDIAFYHEARTKIYCEECADILRKEKNAARNRRYRRRIKARA